MACTVQGGTSPAVRDSPSASSKLASILAQGKVRHRMEAEVKGLEPMGQCGETYLNRARRSRDGLVK